MSEQHVTSQMLQRLQRQELRPEERLAALRHVSVCPECTRLVDPAWTPPWVLEEEVGNESLHLDAATQVFPWVDGALDAAEREIVETHLEDCAICRAETDDLREAAAARAVERPVPPRRWWLAAAGVLLALAGAVAIRRVTPPTPPPPQPRVAIANARPPYANAEWSRLIGEAVRTHRLPLTEFAALRPAADPLRGGTSRVHAALRPAGVVVAEPRPRFTWRPVEDATYVVSVFDGASEVAASGVLTGSWWTPSADLPEERTLAWQVEVTQGGRRFIVPAPPAPPALFRVASRHDRMEIAAARARYPDDHLLHAVLYARAGLEAEAEAALRRAVAAGDSRAATVAAR